MRELDVGKHGMGALYSTHVRPSGSWKAAAAIVSVLPQLLNPQLHLSDNYHYQHLNLNSFWRWTNVTQMSVPCKPWVIVPQSKMDIQIQSVMLQLPNIQHCACSKQTCLNYIFLFAFLLHNSVCTSLAWKWRESWTFFIRQIWDGHGNYYGLTKGKFYRHVVVCG